MGAVLGIDPGAVSTGIVLVNLDGPPRLLHSVTVMAPKPSPLLPVLPLYEARVLEVLAGLDRDFVIDLAGVEGVTRPSWHVGARGGAAANPEALLATAWIAGACSATLAAMDGVTSVVVPPAGNGGGPLASYPAELVTDRERAGHLWQTRPGSSAARLRHVRSAYDVAVMAHRSLARKASL